MYKHLPLLLFTTCFGHAMAQVSSIDTAQYSEPYKKAIALYDKVTGKNGGLYVGAGYEYYPNNIKGDAYYPSKVWQRGSLVYNEAEYYNVTMLYDLVKDAVVVQPSANEGVLSPSSDKVTSFTLPGHNYKHIIADSVNNLSKTGFYEVLYPGKTEVLLRREKVIQTSTAMEKYFAESVSYYVKYNDAYYKTGSKGSMLNVLEDKKAMLQQYIKAQKLNFGKDKEQSLIQLASYYDQITQ